MRLVGIVLLLLVVSSSTAEAEKAFQLVGFTAGKVGGTGGLLAMARTCQAEFPASRMCTSEELIRTTHLPQALPETRAWVQPVPRAVFEGFHPEPGVLDVARTIRAPGAGSCYGWSGDGPSTQAAAQGMTVDSQLRFQSEACSFELSIACCALIPVPEPPQSFLESAAGAALASAFAARAVCSIL